jgi:transposase InsO family protein
MAQMASMDFFTVPTATFRVLFVFLVLSHDRRRILHWNITERATEEWTVQQLREAFPWDEAPRYLIRDRDAIFGREIGATIKGMGTEAVVTAARSPWQNPFVERLIGSIRRDCLDHVIVWNESSLHRVLQSYFEYYERSRTHLALNKDAPVSRPVEEPANGPHCGTCPSRGTPSSIPALRRLARLFGNALSPTFGRFVDKQLFPEIPRQCEFSGIQSGRLADQDFHRLDIFINLADQKRQFA